MLPNLQSNLCTMGKAEVEEKEDVFQAILLADNFGLSIFGSNWAEKQNPGANRFLDDDLDAETESNNDTDEQELAAELTQEVGLF